MNESGHYLMYIIIIGNNIVRRPSPQAMCSSNVARRLVELHGVSMVEACFEGLGRS